MLPIVLNPVNLKAGLAGQGPARARRAATLAEAGVEAQLFDADVPDSVLASLQVLFVAGLDEGIEQRWAGRAIGQMGLDKVSLTRCQGVIQVVRDPGASVPTCQRHAGYGDAAFPLAGEGSDQQHSPTPQSLLGGRQLDLLDPCDLGHRESLHVVEHQSGPVDQR